MSNSNVNVIVHVKQTLAAAQLGALQTALADQAGVVRAQPSTRSHQLILVDYDPRRVSAQAILGRVRGQGLDARLIGM